MTMEGEEKTETRRVSAGKRNREEGRRRRANCQTVHAEIDGISFVERTVPPCDAKGQQRRKRDDCAQKSAGNPEAETVVDRQQQKATVSQNVISWEDHVIGERQKCRRKLSAPRDLHDIKRSSKGSHEVHHIQRRATVPEIVWHRGGPCNGRGTENQQNWTR